MKTKTNTSPNINGISVQKLAELSSLSECWLYKLARSGVLPQATRGQFPTEAITALFAYLQQRHGDGTLQHEQYLKVKAEREMLEHKLADFEASHFRRSEVQAAVAQIGSAIERAMTQKLGEFPAMAAQKAPPELQPVIRSTAEQVAKETAEEIAGHLRYAAKQLQPAPGVLPS